MQKEPDTQFRFTPQVALILIIVFFAMAIPVVCVVLAAQNYFEKTKPASDTAAAAPLQKALEDVADKAFNHVIQLPAGDVVVVKVSDLHAGQKLVENRIRQLGGTAFPSESSQGPSVRLVVQIPASRVTKFKESPLQSPADEGNLGPAADVEARTLLDVLIEKPSE